MKKLIALLLLLCLTLSVIACGPKLSDEEILESEKKAYDSFMADLADEDLVAQNVRVLTTEDGRRFLCADFKNNMSVDLQATNIKFSLAIWNKNGIPITIRSERNPDNTMHIFEVDMSDLTIKAGEVWSATRGLALDPACTDIAYGQACIVSCTTAEGEKINPLYEAWKQTFPGIALSDWQIQRMSPTKTDSILSEEEQAKADYAKLKADLQTGNAEALNTKLYDDLDDDSLMLGADVKNNISVTISSLSVAFAAWDAEGKPVLIKSASGKTEDSHLKEVNFNEAVAAGETWVADKDNVVTGYRIANAAGEIHTVKAVVISYKADDGTEWRNPFYEQWKETFKNMPLESWMVE